MGYTMLKNQNHQKKYNEYSLEAAAMSFIRNSCEELRFDPGKMDESITKKYTGSSLKAGQIPFNMQMDIDRLCMENAVGRFLQSGKKEDAFDVYFCYLEMFVGDYEKTCRMIELLSEFEANGSGLLMKHRDHYAHSVYVFILGLAVYESNEIYREKYKKYYGLADEHKAAFHYLQYWGLASLFHDIGYPFELPFEQVASYFEVNGDKRESRPFVAYNELDSFLEIDGTVSDELAGIYDGHQFKSTNDLFAYILSSKLSKVYPITEEQMLTILKGKPTEPDKFNFFMDHAYFSATVLFKKLFCEMDCKVDSPSMDALTAILMHNSLHKFSITFYKGDKNIPLKAELYPLAYMLMLCDELQCWDRTAYGRNSKKELHPMGCEFDFRNNRISATYLYDEKEIAKINAYKDAYIKCLTHESMDKPTLKAYSGMFEKNEAGVSSFQEDIERIVDLSDIKLYVDTGLRRNLHLKKYSYLSESNYLHLYNFAIVLNGRWDNEEWKKAKSAGKEEQFINDKNNEQKFIESFKNLSLEYKLSNINQAKAFAKYMDKIDCFYSDKSVDFDMVEKFTNDDLIKIGVFEHQRWLQEHYDMGWEYGTPEKSERELVRQHEDLIPDFNVCQGIVTEEQARENYDRLDKAEQEKDTDPMECMLAMLKMFDGLRIYRLR